MSKEKDFIEKSFEEMTEDERLKYEIAVDKVKEEGWKALSASETGRIGGLMTKRKRQKTQEAED